MLAPQLGPSGKVVLRRRGGHFALEADDFAAEAGLDGCVFRWGGGEGGGEGGVERP